MSQVRQRPFTCMRGLGEDACPLDRLEESCAQTLAQRVAKYLAEEMYVPAQRSVWIGRL
jgi:hypothetical protein